MNTLNPRVLHRQSDRQGIVLATADPEPERNIFTSHTFLCLNEGKRQAGQIAMGLMHGTDEQGPENEGQQVNKAVLVIDAGDQHDQKQNTTNHPSTGWQDEDVFLAEGLAVRPGNPAVNPVLPSLPEFSLDHAHQAVFFLKSSPVTGMHQTTLSGRP